MTDIPLPPVDETPLSALPSSLPIGPHNLTRGFRFRIDATAKGMKASIQNHLKFTLARDPNTATRRDWYLATAHAVRDRIMERFIATMDAHERATARRVYYLSLEYLMGRMLHNNLYNAGLLDATRDALA